MSEQIADETLALFRVRGRKVRFGQDEDVMAIAADNSAILDLGGAKAGLQWQDFVRHQFRHADRIGAHDVLEHHPFRAGKLAPHDGEVFFDRCRVQL